MLSAVLQGLDILSEEAQRVDHVEKKNDSFDRILEATTTDVLILRPGEDATISPNKTLYFYYEYLRKIIS